MFLRQYIYFGRAGLTKIRSAGYLSKKSSKSINKDWKKKYVTLCEDGRLTYHPTLHDYMEDTHGKEILLKHTTVKVPMKRVVRTQLYIDIPMPARHIDKIHRHNSLFRDFHDIIRIFNTRALRGASRKSLAAAQCPVQHAYIFHEANDCAQAGPKLTAKVMSCEAGAALFKCQSRGTNETPPMLYSV